VRGGNLLDTLCAWLETLMWYEQGERNLVMLQHKFVVEWADGSEVCTVLFFFSVPTEDLILVDIYSKRSHRHWNNMGAGFRADTQQWR
jgi:hypothetical protein